MRLRGLPAAGCVLLCGIALLGSACSDNAPLAHTCSATDRQFIDTAQMSMTGLGLTSDQFQEGMSSPKDVASAATLAARNVKATEPSDYSLRQIQALMGAMFSEYARAMTAEAKHKDAGPHIQRSYGLANFAHDVLVQAEPGLKARGCDVSPLL
jgi:hypothetical protein